MSKNEFFPFAFHFKKLRYRNKRGLSFNQFIIFELLVMLDVQFNDEQPDRLNDGYFYHSIGSIKRDTTVSEGTVKNTIKKLVDMNLFYHKTEPPKDKDNKNEIWHFKANYQTILNQLELLYNSRDKDFSKIKVYYEKQRDNRDFKEVGQRDETQNENLPSTALGEAIEGGSHSIEENRPVQQVEVPQSEYIPKKYHELIKTMRGADFANKCVFEKHSLEREFYDKYFTHTEKEFLQRVQREDDCLEEREYWGRLRSFTSEIFQSKKVVMGLYIQFPFLNRPYRRNNESPMNDMQGKKLKSLLEREKVKTEDQNAFIEKIYANDLTSTMINQVIAFLDAKSSSKRTGFNMRIKDIMTSS